MNKNKAVTSKLSCVVFDFDGTIADTILQVMHVCNKLSEEYKFRRLNEDEIDIARDMSAAQFFRYLKIPQLKLPIILAKGKKMLSEHVHELKPFPGMVEVIREIRGEVPVMGILTSNSKTNVEMFLKDHDLDVFDFISTVSKLSGKAKHLKAILRTFDLYPQNMVMVGDEIRDVKAAQKAKIQMVAVDWGFNSAKVLKDRKPDYLISKPEEFISIMKNC